MSVRLENVSFSYGELPICRGLNWRLPDKGIVCLWGASGCGKTTLLRLLAGLEKPSDGRIVGLEHAPVSVCFQEDRLLPWRTALDNVALPIGGDQERAAEVLTALGLGDYLHSQPSQLSGGQQRRVALARALACPADLLLLDEPFTGMDAASWGAVIPLIRQWAQTRPVVLVTHVAQEAEALGARVIPLSSTPLTGELDCS